MFVRGAVCGAAVWVATMGFRTDGFRTLPRELRAVAERQSALWETEVNPSPLQITGAMSVVGGAFGVGYVVARRTVRLSGVVGGALYGGVWWGIAEAIGRSAPSRGDSDAWVWPPRRYLSTFVAQGIVTALLTERDSE